MKRTLWLLLAALVAASMMLAACGPKETPEAGEQAVATPIHITVGTDATWPPFESIDEATQEFIGFDVDLIRAIAEVENLEIELVNVPWDSLLAGMATCQYDVAISAMTITEERAASFLFSDPYFSAGQLVVVQFATTDIASEADLVGKSVGVQLGTTGDIAVTAMEGVEVRRYDEIAFAFQDLMNGQVDAVVADNPLSLGYVGEYPDQLKAVGEPFTDEYYGIAICKTRTDLLEIINRGLATVMGEGLIEQLALQWITVSGE